MDGTDKCDHKFVFLREEVRTGGGWRPESQFYDVFFCEKCLAYEKKKVAETVTYGDGRRERRSLI